MLTKATLLRLILLKGIAGDIFMYIFHSISFTEKNAYKGHTTALNLTQRYI